MKKLLPLILLTALVGCATNSGVIPISENQFFISKKEQPVVFLFKGSLKAEAIQEGQSFCRGLSKEFELISDKSVPIPASVEIIFSCN